MNTHLFPPSDRHGPKTGDRLPPESVIALARNPHRLQRAIDRGDVADRAAVAAGWGSRARGSRHSSVAPSPVPLLGLTRARVTELLGQLILTPDLQVAVLRLEAIDSAEPLAERTLRAVAHAGTWGRATVGMAKLTSCATNL